MPKPEEHRGGAIDRTFARIARRLEQPRARAEQRLPAIIEPPVSTPSHQWISVAKAASELVGTLSGVPGAGQAVNLLAAISGAEDAQNVLLTSIARDVNLIRVASFRAAQEHLSTARDYEPQHPDYQHELREAQGSLVDALSKAASEEEQSFIRYQLGLVGLLRGDSKYATRQLTGSYQLCQKVVGHFIEMPQNFDRDFDRERDKPLNRALDVLPSSPVGSVAKLARDYARRKLGHARVDYKAATRLAGYAPFVSAVARTLNAATGAATQPGLVSCDSLVFT